MDLTPFAKADDLIAVRVQAYSITGGERGVVVGCVLELEWATGERTFREESFDQETAPNLASFLAFIKALNRTLARKHERESP